VVGAAAVSSSREPAAVDSSRGLVLARVREAISDAAPAPAPARTYRRAGELSPQARIELLCERIADYRAEVRRVRKAELPEAIAAAFAAHRAERVCIPAALPAAWRPAQLELVEDHELPNSLLDSLDGVLTGATLAIAQTGTIVLSGGPSEGRRALTLIPDLHVCVIEEHQVVELLPEAIAALGEVAGMKSRPITFISGPSATSDIELRRVEGVHGPRRLSVLVAGEDPGPSHGP
jgi:L-lactate dehydrogenase complex protein LldG